MELPLKSPATTLFLFQILVFCSEVVYTLFPDADELLKNLKVPQVECRSLTKNTIYALNQVRQCHITLEEIEISQTKILLYTKQFRKELNATKCRIQHEREKWRCEHNAQSSINHALAGGLVISPEQCRSLAEGKMIYLVDHFFEVEYNTKNPIVITDASTSDNIRNHCTARGWITRDTFLLHMQRTTLRVRMSGRKASSDSAQVVPISRGKTRF